MTPVHQRSDKPGFLAPSELTLEGLIDRNEVKAVLLFKSPLSYEEALIAKVAWEKGLEQGVEIGRREAAGGL